MECVVDDGGGRGKELSATVFDLESISRDLGGYLAATENLLLQCFRCCDILWIILFSMSCRFEHNL